MDIVHHRFLNLISAEYNRSVIPEKVLFNDFDFLHLRPIAPFHF